MSSNEEQIKQIEKDIEVQKHHKKKAADYYDSVIKELESRRFKLL